MRPPCFGSRELYRCVTFFKFIPKTQRGTSHLKFNPPPNTKLKIRQRNFVMQTGRKEYDPHSRIRYIKQLMEFGLPKQEILKHLK